MEGTFSSNASTPKQCGGEISVWSMNGDTLAPLLSPWDVTSTILQLKGSKPVRVVILMWFLWSERNAVRENGHGRSAEILARSIRIYSEEIIRESTRQGQARERRTDKWHRSPAGVLKLNCDASYKAAERSGSWGFVIRDNDGDVVMTGRGRINHLLSPFQAEVIACLQGIQTALNLGIGKLTGDRRPADQTSSGFN